VCGKRLEPDAGLQVFRARACGVPADTGSRATVCARRRQGWGFLVGGSLLGYRYGFASLLMMLTAVDAGLGACFFGIPVERIGAYRAAFGVPAHFTPIGAISVGYGDEPPRDLSSRRKPEAETVHRGQWTRSAT
jgi:nitroreductase